MANQCMEYTGSDSAYSGDRVRGLRYNCRKVSSAVQSVCLLVVLGDLLMVFTFLSLPTLYTSSFVLLLLLKGNRTDDAFRTLSTGMEYNCENSFSTRFLVLFVKNRRFLAQNLVWFGCSFCQKARKTTTNNNNNKNNQKLKNKQTKQTNKQTNKKLQQKQQKTTTTTKTTCLFGIHTNQMPHSPL